MVTGLLFYLWGQRYLPAQTQQPRTALPAAPRENMARDTLLLLLGLGVAVAIFRSAYEQVGNTVALWADVGVDKKAGEFSIPMTWFIAINPLCVMLITRCCSPGGGSVKRPECHFCPRGAWRLARSSWVPPIYYSQHSPRRWAMSPFTGNGSRCSGWC
jgi:hypothetical protein